MMHYDRIILGAGFYGLYSALCCVKAGEKILVIEKDDYAFTRATYINQARVHMGYHYPRSLATARKSAGYFNRFCQDFAFCINNSFEQIYATSSQLSWTNKNEYKNFCKNAGISCFEVDPDKYFKEGMCDGVFCTTEYTFDALLLRDWILLQISKYPNAKIHYGSAPTCIRKVGGQWEIKMPDGMLYTDYILNTTYAGVNEILKITEAETFDPFKIKYEKCEIILCKVNNCLKCTGLTVMDGPFFSIMPFGKTGLHSLTSVTFTPHETSYDTLPSFSCQRDIDKNYCMEGNLGNCNNCAHKPISSWPYMKQLANKYLKDKFKIEYYRSLYSIKPILLESEVDDSRPTIIRKHCSHPTFVSVLSGKINTVYDLEEVLFNE